MKKLFIAIGITFLTVLSFEETKAQSRFDYEFSFGVAGAQIDGDDLGGYDKPGFQLAGGTGIQLNENLRVGIELMISHKGSKRRLGQNESPLNRIVYRLNYTEFPIFFRYKVQEKIYFSYGLSTGYLLSARLLTAFSDDDITNQFFRYDVQALGGFSYQISDLWQGEIRLARSFLPITDRNTVTGYRFYTHTLYMSLQYQLKN